MTKIILVRHGESLSNLQGMAAGHLDVPLTALGKEQAEQTAAHLAQEHIDAIYSSDLRRAVDTATPHATRRGLCVIKCEDLREINCGRWEGRKFKELEEKEYELFVKGFRERFFKAGIPEGETVLECGTRFYRAVARIAAQNAGKTVLIVGHGAVLRAFWAMVCGTSFDDENADALHPYPSNASYSVVNFEDDRFIPLEFSKDSHLTTVTHIHL